MPDMNGGPIIAFRSGGIGREKKPPAALGKGLTALRAGRHAQPRPILRCCQLRSWIPIVLAEQDWGYNSENVGTQSHSLRQLDMYS